MRNIAILLFDDVEELEFIGPLQVFGTAARLGATCSVAILSDHSPITCRLGTRIDVNKELRSAPPSDLVIVPGGPGAAAVCTDARFLRYLRKPHGLVTAVGTGSRIVAAAGLPIDASVGVDMCSASAGIEIALGLVERLWSARIARAVAALVCSRRTADRLPSGIRGLF
jgi:putative intracellular protease/amidase